MVCAHLATIEHIIITHALLHKSMTALATHGHSAITLQNILGIPGQARVEHNLGTGLL